MPYNNNWCTVEIKRWYMPFWLRLDFGILFNSVEEAKAFIESHRNPIIL